MFTYQPFVLLIKLTKQLIKIKDSFSFVFHKVFLKPSSFEGHELSSLGH